VGGTISELCHSHLMTPALLPDIRGINQVFHRWCKELLSNLECGPGVSTVVLDTSRDDIPDGIDVAREFRPSKACRFFAKDLTIPEKEERCVHPFFKQTEVQIEELAFKRTGLLQVSGK
jgi:hypothetical protein